MNGRADLLFWLRFGRRLAVGMVLVYVGVAVTLGGTTSARPALYGLAGLLCLALFALRRKLPDGSPGWEIAATNAAVLLVACEWTLQGYAAVSGRSLLLDNSLDAHRLRPGHDYGDGLYGNRLGYPGPELPARKRPDVFRIAALGDSFAVGPAVPFADCYLTRLAKEMPAMELGNFGVSGAGPREYRLILERDVWPVQPDLVLLSIFVGNDITETIARPRHLDPRQHALGILCERGWRLARECCREAPTAAPTRLARPALSPRTFREVEARRLALCRKDVSPATEKQWANALKELEGILRACRERQAPLAVVLIPDEFQVNEATLALAMAEAGLERGQLDLEEPQRRLAAFFKARGVPCLDLLPRFRQCPDSYAPCDTHWNVAGNHLAARAIADWLRESAAVKPGPG